MFDLPQPLLRQLLTVKNTNPERLSTMEIDIVNRIRHCSLCDGFWVKRLRGEPPRCPKCHKRGWDRPLITAMLTSLRPTTTPTPGAIGNLPPGGNL